MNAKRSRSYPRPHLRLHPSAYLPTYDTPAMRRYITALEHELRRVFMRERRAEGPRQDRLNALLQKAYLAAEGLMIRTKIANYPDWRNPFRQNRGPRS